MTQSVSPVPEGYPTVAPYLIVDDAPRMIAFLEAAFDGKLIQKAEDNDGGVIHAELRIGDSVVMLGSANAEWPALRAMIHLYLPDVDHWYEKALAAGAESVRAPADMPYGDRSGGVADPAGNQWWIATRVSRGSGEGNTP